MAIAFQSTHFLVCILHLYACSIMHRLIQIIGYLVSLVLSRFYLFSYTLGIVHSESIREVNCAYIVLRQKVTRPINLTNHEIFCIQFIYFCYCLNVLENIDVKWNVCLVCFIRVEHLKTILEKSIQLHVYIILRFDTKNFNRLLSRVFY